MRILDSCMHKLLFGFSCLLTLAVIMRIVARSITHAHAGDVEQSCAAKAVTSWRSQLKVAALPERQQAANCLCILARSDKSVFPDCALALKDKDKEVRMIAVPHLGDMRENKAEAIKALTDARKDPDRDVRQGAEAMLMMLQTPR